MPRSPMKFFTPDLIRRSQSDRFSDAEWRSVSHAYRARVGEILAALPWSVRRLAGTYFHDCKVRRVEFAAPDTVVIRLDGFKHFWGSRRVVRGTHRLTFKNVVQTDVAHGHLSADWAYEEVDWTGQTSELRVLLANGEQFHIRFRTVAVRTDKAAEPLAPSPRARLTRESQPHDGRAHGSR